MARQHNALSMMRALLAALLVLACAAAVPVQKAYYTNARSNSVLWLSMYTPNSHYLFRGVREANSSIESFSIRVPYNGFAQFNDSLLQAGFRPKMKKRPVKTPALSAELATYAYSGIMHGKDSVFEFSLHLELQPKGMPVVHRQTKHYHTYSSAQLLRERLSTTNIAHSAIRYAGTHIHQLTLVLERVSDKPPRLLPNGNFLDYNYSASVYY